MSDASNYPAPTLESLRLQLLPLRADHAESLFTLLSDKEHTRFLSFPTATHLEEVCHLTEGLLSDPKNRLWVITERTSQAFVGICGFLCDSTVPNFIYSIAQHQQGRGYAFEAATTAIAVGRRLLKTDC